MIFYLKAHTVDKPLHQCLLSCQSPCHKERQYRHIDNWIVYHMEGMFLFVQPDPVTRSDLQGPLCGRLSESNDITTHGFHTYSVLVKHILVHISDQSLLCDLCASNYRYSIKRVPNDTIQAMKYPIFKHRTNEMVQSVISEWYPGKSLKPHHIKLIRKLFVDFGESCVERLTRRVINAIVHVIHLGCPINCFNNQMYSFSHQAPEMFSFEVPAEKPIDVSDSVITSSVVFQSNQTNTMPSCVIDKIPTDDEVQITNDSNPNRPLLFLSLHIL